MSLPGTRRMMRHWRKWTARRSRHDESWEQMWNAGSWGGHRLRRARGRSGANDLCEHFDEALGDDRPVVLAGGGGRGGFKAAALGFVGEQAYQAVGKGARLVGEQNVVLVMHVEAFGADGG